MYHVTVALEVKPCSCKKSCRTKHGQFTTKREANDFVRKMKNAKNSKRTKKEQVKDTELSDDAVELIEAVDGKSEAPILVEDNVEVVSETTPEVISDESIEVTKTSKEYFDDDEDFLLAADETIEKDHVAALFKQSENAVYCSIENFYNDDGRRRGKFALRSSPPIFRIESSDGSIAEFMVTKDMSSFLAELFTDVHRGFYGMNGKGKLSSEPEPPFLQKVSDWVKRNPIRSSVVILLLIFILVVSLL